MSLSKIEISIGNFKFTGEGEPKWLSEQLDKILRESSKLIKLAPSLESKPDEPQKEKKVTTSTVSLAKLLKDHNATSNQNMKFLGGAIYISIKGAAVVKTADVTKALRDAGQTRLSNPSSCLGENVKKGFLEKVSGGFMVTVHGKEQFGITEN